MKPWIARLVLALPALSLAAGLVLAARPAAPDEDRSGICVGSMEIVACVPPEHT